MFDVGQPIPAVLLGPDGAEYKPSPRFAAVSSLALLVAAAQKAGRLVHISQLAEPLAAEKVSGTAPLAALEIAAPAT